MKGKESQELYLVEWRPPTYEYKVAFVSKEKFSENYGWGEKEIEKIKKMKDFEILEIPYEDITIIKIGSFKNLKKFIKRHTTHRRKKRGRRDERKES